MSGTVRTQILALLALGALTACETTGASQQVKVTDDFSRIPIEWGTIGTAVPPGLQTLALEIVPIDNVLYLCGAWAHEGTSGQSTARQALRDYNLTASGRTVISGFQYFSKAPSAAALTGSMANCASTGLAANAGPYEFNIDQNDRGPYRIS